MAIIESDVKVQGTGTGGPVDTVRFTKTVIVDGNPVIVTVDREGVWQGSKDSANPAYQEYESYLAGRVVLWGPNNEPLLKTLDYDTGAGTDNRPAVGVLLPKSGGAVAGGTSTDPLRVDPTGSTTQPVAGSVTANQGAPGGSAWPVDGSGVTQPVSGAVTANAGTNLNTSALALEAGGNLAAILAKLLGSLAVTGTFWQAKQPVSEGDGDNAALGTTSDLATASTGIGLLKAIKAAVQGTLTATISGSVAVTGTFWQAVQPVSGTFWQATQPVSGTFWQAKQPVSLADGDDATQGVKADAADAHTDTTAITGMSVWKQISKSVQAIATSVAGSLTATVSGTVTANAGTNLNTSALAVESGGHLAAVDSVQGTTTDAAATTGTGGTSTIAALLRGIFNKLLGSIAVTQSGTWTVQPGNTANTTAWKVDGSAVTQPISAASLPLPASASQDGTDGTGITPPTGAAGIRGWLSGIFNKLNTSIAVTGTFWQAVQPVSGSVTANAGTNLNTSALALESGGNLAASKADLDTLAALFTTATPARNVQANRNATGNLTAQSGANSTVAIDTTGMAVVYFSLSGTYSAGGNPGFEGFDGSSWQTLAAVFTSRPLGTQYLQTSTTWGGTVNGTEVGFIRCSGFQQVRIHCTAFTSGSVAVIFNASAASPFTPNPIVGGLEHAPGTHYLADVDSANALAGNLRTIGPSAQAIDTNSGNKSAGTVRILLATDQPQLTNALKVAGSSGNALAVNPPSTGQVGTDVLSAAPLLWSPQNSFFVPRFDNSWRTILPVVARATAVQQNSSVFTCQGRAGWIILICTAKAAATTLTMQVGGIEAIGGGGFFGIATTAALAVGVNQMIGVVVGLGIAGTPNSTNFIAAPTIANVPMPGQILVAVTAGDASSVTYGVEFCSF